VGDVSCREPPAARIAACGADQGLEGAEKPLPCPMGQLREHDFRQSRDGFGQSRVGDAIGRRRQGAGQAEGLGEAEAGHRHHPRGPAPGPHDAPFQGGEGFGVLGDGGEQPVQQAGVRGAAQGAVRGIGAAEVLGEVAPGALGTGDPEDGVPGGAKVFGRAAERGGAAKQGGEGGPFGVGDGVPWGGSGGAKGGHGGPRWREGCRG